MTSQCAAFRHQNTHRMSRFRLICDAPKLLQAAASNGNGHCVRQQGARSKCVWSNAPGYLHIGLTLPQWPVRDFYEFEAQSWFIQCSDELLKERGEFGPRRGTPIGRDSVVSVEKDARTRSLRFRVDGTPTSSIRTARHMDGDTPDSSSLPSTLSLAQYRWTTKELKWKSSIN